MSKDLFIQEQADRFGALSRDEQAAMQKEQEYQAWCEWQGLLAWSDDRIAKADQWFWDLRNTNLPNT